MTYITHTSSSLNGHVDILSNQPFVATSAELSQNDRWQMTLQTQFSLWLAVQYVCNSINECMHAFITGLPRCLGLTSEVITLAQFTMPSPDTTFTHQRCTQPRKCNNFCLLIYLNLLYMFRATNSPILRSTFWLYIQLWYNAPILLPTDDKVPSQHRLAAISVHCTKAVYTVKNCFWRWVNLLPETCTADSNRSIKRSINKNCCILLVTYIIVLMMHGLTNIKFTHHYWQCTWNALCDLQITPVHCHWMPECDSLIVKTIHCALTPDITSNIFKQYATPCPPVLTVTCFFHTIPHFPAPRMKPMVFQGYALYALWASP